MSSQNHGNPSFDPSRLGHLKLRDPVRVGVLGLGRIGWLHHAATVMWHNGFNLAAVCDIEASRVDQAVNQTGCAGYVDDYSGFLKQEDLELVVVASQSIDHERHTLRALRAHKHVLCEKPACRTPAGLDRMQQAAETAGRLLAIHHNQRLYPECLAVKEIIDSGRLGKLLRIQRIVGDFRRRSDWQVLKKYQGGVAANWGVHVIDQSLHLAESPVEKVWGVLGRHFSSGDAEDDLKAMIQCENGVVIDIEVSDVDASHRPQWVVLGDRGSLWIQDKMLYRRTLSGAVKPIEVVDRHLAEGRSYHTPRNGRLRWSNRQRPATPTKRYAGFYDNLYRAIRHQDPLLVPAHSARPVYEVLARIRRGTDF